MDIPVGWKSSYRQKSQNKSRDRPFWSQGAAREAKVVPPAKRRPAANLTGKERCDFFGQM